MSFNLLSLDSITRSCAPIMRKSAPVLLLASMLCACAGADDVDDSVEHGEIQEITQELNGDTIEVMKSQGSTTYHNQRLNATSWTGWNSSISPARAGELLVGIEGSMVGSNTQWIQYGTALFHNERYRSNGSWAWGRNNWSQTPGSRLPQPNGPVTASYRDVGMAEVDDGQGHTELHVCAVWGWYLLVHQVRHFDGSWTNVSAVSLPATHQSLSSVDCVAEGRDLRVFYNNANRLYEVRRFSNGSWALQGEIPTGPSGVGRITATSALGNLQLLYVGNTNGALYHRAGNSGTFNIVPGSDVLSWSDVSAADVSGGSISVVVLSANRLNQYHAIGTQFGWTPFAPIFNNVSGQQANNVSVAQSKF